MAITKSDIPDLLLPGLKTEFELAYRSELAVTVVKERRLWSIRVLLSLLRKGREGASDA